jgi:ABC-type transporter Mla subunit MlaD
MGKHPLLTIAAVGIIAVGLMIALGKPAQFHLNAKCYFQDAQGLREGARVRLAGVDVGSVTSIRVRPEFRENPAEVTMFLQTPYELRIPNDSVVTLETAGLLGEVFPQIDISGASGPPLVTDGVLKTRASDAPTAQRWVERLSHLAAQKPCDLHSSKVNPNQGAAPSHPK